MKHYQQKIFEFKIFNIPKNMIQCRKELHVYAHIFVTKKRNVNEQIEITRN